MLLFINIQITSAHYKRSTSAVQLDENFLQSVNEAAGHKLEEKFSFVPKNCSSMIKTEQLGIADNCHENTSIPQKII